MPDKPNPGSVEAIALGCTCPRGDNHNGEGVVVGGVRGFWKAPDCPVHPSAVMPRDPETVDMFGDWNG